MTSFSKSKSGWHRDFFDPALASGFLSSISLPFPSPFHKITSLSAMSVAEWQIPTVFTSRQLTREWN